MKQLNRQVAIYIGCCIETRENDGRRDLATIRLFTLTWLIAVGVFLMRLPDMHLAERLGFALTWGVVILATVTLLKLRLLGKIPTPLGVLN
jgi:hypothetical protein